MGFKMSSEMLAALHEIDHDIINGVARRSLGLPEFEITDFTVSALLHEKVIETTGGLFRFAGRGLAGGLEKPWSAVLKIIRRPGDDCLIPRELCYWRREVLGYETSLLADLPNAVRAPGCYGVSELEQAGTHSAWIWLEDIQETVDSRWSLAHFQQAARKFGQFAGAYLNGRPVPNMPWLCGSLFRSFYADGDWWAKFTDPASRNNAWQRPLVQAVYSEALRARVLKIWAEKRQWIAANERLPQVFCHNDAHRRNLMLRGDGNGKEELIAIDWAFCGPGSLGNDLGQLIGTSLSYFAVDPLQAADLETAVLEGYLAGLRDAGWSGGARLARLGYLISLALYWGGTLPCEIAQAQPGEGSVNVEAKYGRTLEAVLPGWTRLAEFALDRAEEGRFMLDHV
jgi:hypothetical protein